MTTAERLEAMTDAGQFEILSLRVLRELRHDCRSIIHLGVNAEGKTIPNPIDGFCQIPDTQLPRYVMVAFTISKTDDLHRKWLLDSDVATSTSQHSKRVAKARKSGTAADGDLIKAARQAAIIREREPTAEFKVYLCTNRRLQLDLIRDVQSKGRELGLTVDFLEQTQLRDFLDIKPEGQWLRQHYLGIVADQVSRSLLSDLSQASLERYCSEMPGFSSHPMETNAARIARQGLNPSTRLHLLIGASGFGKSIISQDLMRCHIKCGGVALWIPGDVAERAVGLSDAIEEVLCSLHPALGPGAGQAALQLADSDAPLVVAVDDINRSKAPLGLLRKVTGWARPVGIANSSEQPTRTSIHIVCPVWDSHWSELHTETEKWVHIQLVGPFLRTESINYLCVELGNLADKFHLTELDDIAKNLADDPILFALLCRMMRNEPSANAMSLAEDVIGRMIEHAVAELAVGRQVPPLVYVDALRHMAKTMIRRKSLYPRWNELSTWFEDSSRLRALEQLAAQGHVCRISRRGSESIFEFRHDRILDYHLSDVIGEFLTVGDGTMDDIWDPFFVPYLGRALARRQCSKEVLDRVSAMAPVALIAALRFLPASTDYAREVAKRAREWLSFAKAPKALRNDALGILVETQSPHVLEITKGLPESLSIDEARLRNGDPWAGARVLSREFFPGTNFPWLEALIEQAKVRHGRTLVAGLKTILATKRIADDLCCGALGLAGYLGESALATDVEAFWNAATNREQVIVPALWAALRCSSEEPARLIGPMVRFVSDLDNDTAGGTRMSEQARALEEVGFAMRHGVAESVLRYLVDLAENEAYRWLLTVLVEKLDHPLAVSLVVRQLASYDHKAKQVGGFSPFASTWADTWRSRRGGRTLSEASIAELKSLWEVDSHPDWLRGFAFRTWASCGGDIRQMLSINETSCLFDDAVWHRALRGDQGVARWVIARLDAKQHWLRIVPRIWCGDFEPIMDKRLAKLSSDPTSHRVDSNEDHWLAEVLRDIPVEDAQRLLLRYWEGLRLRPCFIQAALYLSTDVTRARAAESLRDKRVSAETFEYIEYFFGFHILGLMDRLSMEHLVSLEPYLSDLRTMCVDRMVDFCGERGLAEWATRHLRPECLRRMESGAAEDKEIAMLSRSITDWLPTDDELLQSLNQIERTEDATFQAYELERWSEMFVKRGDAAQRMPKIIGFWLGQSSTESRFSLACSAIERCGKRKFLDVLRAQPLARESREAQSRLAEVQYAVFRRSLE